MIKSDLKYDIRRMGVEDESIVQQLCLRCPDYFLTVEGRLPPAEAGREILTELPAGKDSRDKFVLGVFNEKAELIGIIDLVRNFREELEWTLGLMMIDPAERGKGLGRDLHGYIEDFVRQFQTRSLRLGVAVDNPRALKFWSGLGYEETGRCNYRLGNKENEFVVMRAVIAY